MCVCGGGGGSYAEVAERHGLTPAQLALAWAAGREYMGAVVIGATSLAQARTHTHTHTNTHTHRDLCVCACVCVCACASVCVFVCV